MGLYALVIPLLLIIFEPIYAVIYNRLFSQFMLYNLLTFVGCSVILLIPVICMGATLPVLCRFYVTELSHLGTHAGRLYGLNTIGAATGSLLCGFWLIELLGVWGTLIFAVLVNCLIGLSCILAGHKLERRQEDRIVGASPEPLREGAVASDELAGYPAVVTAALVIFAVSGFCSMAYEVIWTRLLGLIVGPTTYSFTIVLVTFILGLALGSMFFGTLADRTGKAVWLLVYTQTGAALFALGVSQLLGGSQLFFAKLLFSLQNHFVLLNLAKAVTLFAFMIFPTFCLGATFPLVCKIYAQSMSRLGWSIGFAYTINTIGAVLGSFCAGFVLIPLLGKEKGLSIVIALQLLVSLITTGIILGRKGAVLSKHIILGALTLAGLFTCFYFPAWNHRTFAEGKYHRFDEIGTDIRIVGWLEALLKGPKILNGRIKNELVYYGDGIGGFTTVIKYVSPFGNIDYSMANSGKMDASSRGDMATQTLSAHFPMLFHRNPRTVMVLGLASGITAGEVLYYPVEQLDVVDINKQVVRGSDFFLPWNNNVLANPKTNLIIQDGRAHLQLTSRKYDVIISEPSNPWMAGLAALFTRDFFELARNRLNEDGIFVQFMHSYQMDWPTFALVGRTFAEVFPNSLLLRTAPSGKGFDYLFVGFNGKSRLSLENAQRKLTYAQRSPNVAISDPRLLYRLIVSEDLPKLFGQGFVDTDSRPRLEFAAPRLLYYNDPAITENIDSRKQLNPEMESVVQQAATDVNSQIDFAAYAMSVHSPFPDSMVDTAKAAPSQKERFNRLMETYYAGNTIDDAFVKDNQLRQRCIDIQIATIEKNIDILPNKSVSYAFLASLYYEKKMLDKAADSLFKSLKFKPENADIYYNLGLVFHSQGRFDDAVSYYRQAIRLGGRDAETYYNLGITLKLQGKIDEAINCYHKALQMKPDYADVHNNLGNALMLQGSLNEAVDHFRRAIGIEPRNAEMHFNLGGALASQGKFSEAVSHFHNALELKPNFAEAHNGLGVTLANQNKADEAVSQFSLALRDDPNNIISLTNMAGILATSPNQNIRDTKKAVVLAERAAELTEHKNPAVLNTLAAAYAASGRFDKAAVTAQKALELAGQSKNEKLINHIREQLELYRLKVER